MFQDARGTQTEVATMYEGFRVESFFFKVRGYGQSVLVSWAITHMKCDGAVEATLNPNPKPRSSKFVALG